MEVDLLSQPNHSLENSSTVKDKRPPNISIPIGRQPSHRWRQCKIIGKNISIRSYGAACSFNNKLYLYGGYQILKGSLQDFYSISLQQNQSTFNWEEIIPSTKVHPGSRQKHSLVSTKNHIYLIGGILLNNTASNDIYKFDPSTQVWELLKPEGATLPRLQSFGTAVVSTGEQQKIIIACGFNQEKVSPSNAVYQYNIATNKLSILFQGKDHGSQDVPQPRAGSAITSDDNNLYIFGGKNQDKRFNDLWCFSLTDYKFKRLSDEGQLPAVRNGHSMNCYDNKLYVFGGIHDITWELDDLHIYSLKTNKWTTLEHDSPRKMEKKINNSSSPGKEAKDRSIPKKKGWYQTAGNIRSGSPVNTARLNHSVMLNEEVGNKNQSPGKMLDEQRKKVFYHKKAEMLKNFALEKEQVSKYVSLQTSSQAMKNSLDVIGNPDPKQKVSENNLTDFGKVSVSKFLGPLANHNNIIRGKKPCARDGHCAVVMGGELVICCGDRHQMSFNDIYKLNLSQASREVKAD